MAGCSHNPYTPCNSCRGQIYQPSTHLQPQIQMQSTQQACAAPLALAGDVQGLLTQNTVVALQGIKVSPTKPADGQVLMYSAGVYSPVNPTTFGVISVDLNSGLTINGSNQLGISCGTLITHCDLLSNTLGDAKYLPKSGGTITGGLLVTGATQLSNLTATGTINLASLAGAGTRQLVVDATGAVSTQPVSTTIYNGNNNGSGAKIFTSKDSNNTFQFNTLVAGDSNTLITEGSGFVTIRTLGEINDITPLGVGLPNSANVYAGAKVGNLIPLKTIQGGTGITVSGTDPNKITIINSAPGVTNLGINLGSVGVNTGQPFINMAGDNLTFRSIIGNTSPTAVTNVTQLGSDIRVSVDAIRDLSFNTTSKILSITGGVSADLSSLTSGFTAANTSSASATLASTVLSVSVPFRFNGANATLPTGTTPIGMNFTSSGTVAITNPSAGVINLESVNTNTLSDWDLANQALGGNIRAQTVGVNLNEANTQTTLTSQQVFYSAVYVPVTTSITGVRHFQRSQGVFTGNNENSLSLYSYSAGTLTRIATTGNNESIWKYPTNTYGASAFTTSVTVTPGIYFVAGIYNTSAPSVIPVIASGAALAIGSQASDMYSNSAKLYATFGAQLTTAGTQSMAGLTASTAPIWFGLY